MPAMPDLEKVIALLDQRFGLETLVVFGSVARGATHAESDIDLAGLFRTRPDPVALIEAGADCERLLGRSIDLVDLAAASPILAMQVMRDGQCVFGANSSVLAHFAASLPSRYFDLKRVRAPAEAALADRIARARS